MYHPEFYFEDGNLVFLVENTLYRVFRSTFIRHSPVFKDLFTLPKPAGSADDGSSDEYPLYLAGILSIDFERLLWVLYPPTYSAHRAQTAEEWTSILDLATRWEFADVRELAVCQLQTLDLAPVERVALARAYDICGRWTLAAYIALCERTQALTLAEATLLGLETTTRVAQLREQLRAKRGAYSAPAHANTQRAPFKETQETNRARRWRSAGSAPASRPLVLAGSAPSRKFSRKPTSGGLSGTARLVADAFGLDTS